MRFRDLSPALKGRAKFTPTLCDEDHFCRPLKRALISFGVVIPGLRSLRSLTRGHYVTRLWRSFNATIEIALLL